MTAPVLLAIVEVPHADRVRCATEGCGHSVYRRVHLVRTGDSTKVYGVDCFTRLFGSTPTGKTAPRYGSGTGRNLTPEECALLTENTERLIEQFEQEHQVQIAEAQRRQALMASRQTHQAQTTQERHAHQLAARAAPVVATPAQREEAEAQARKTLGERFPGVNLDLPGFKGLVDMEVERLLRKSAA